MKSLLLFRLGGLGDLLVAYPSLCLLRKSLPSSFLWLVCRQEYGIILKETEVVDEIISFHERKLAPFFSEERLFDKGQRSWLQKFDGILGWMQKERSLKVDPSWMSSHKENFRLFTYYERSRKRISRLFFHQTRQFLQEKGEKTFRFKECIRLPLCPFPEEEQKAFLGGKELISKEKIAVIHPGSGSRQKCWPFQNFLLIIQRLHQNGMKGVLVSGPAEDWIEDELKGSILPRGWSWLPNLHPLRLAGLLFACSFYLGNDSGVTHLAAACGTRTLALFRKDLKDMWRPYGHVSVLSGQTLEDIGIESVWHVIKEWL
jgi:ADP-heptose:LPS heptosyltransferase